jgi:hypothetical protein
MYRDWPIRGGREMMMLERQRMGMPFGNLERQVLMHPFSSEHLSVDESNGDEISRDEEWAGIKVVSGTQNRQGASSVISTLCALAFIVFVIYALATGNKEEVHKACGDSLWIFILSRLILTFCEGFLICIIGMIQICVLSLSSSDPGNMAFCFVWVGGLMLIALHAVLVAEGSIITSKAMNDVLCNAALTSVSFTHSPLLGILGYIYVALDSIFLLIFTCFGMCSIFISSQS